MKHPNYVPKFDFLFFNPIHGNFVPHSTTEIFGDENSTYQKKTILIGLPGAFTPVCTTYQIPEFEERFDELKEFGIEQICAVLESQECPITKLTFASRWSRRTPSRSLASMGKKRGARLKPAPGGAGGVPRGLTLVLLRQLQLLLLRYRSRAIGLGTARVPNGGCVS